MNFEEKNVFLALSLADLCYHLLMFVPSICYSEVYCLYLKAQFTYGKKVIDRLKNMSIIKKVKISDTGECGI